jgi:hypothetical protein
MRANNRFCEGSRGVITISAVSLNPREPNFEKDFLGEYEVICETALAHESGP